MASSSPSSSAVGGGPSTSHPTTNAITSSSSSSFLTANTSSRLQPGSPSDANSSRTKDRFARSSLSELRELMEEGEKRGIFPQQRIPPRILNSIVHHNLELYCNRSLYHQPYYQLVYELCHIGHMVSQFWIRCRKVQSVEEKHSMKCIATLAITFIFNTYIRLKVKDGITLTHAMEQIKCMFKLNDTVCMSVLDLFCEEGGHRYLLPLLLHCPDSMIRRNTGEVISDLLDSSVAYYDCEVLANTIKRFLIVMTDMLLESVPAALNISFQYFAVLQGFVSKSKHHCHFFINASGFSKLMHFLLGIHLNDKVNITTDKMDCEVVASRNWTTLQLQEFGLLHAICLEVVGCCDTSTLAKGSGEFTFLFSCSRYISC